MGDGNFRFPPHNKHPLTDHQKIWYRWLRRRPLRLCQIWCQSVDRGLLDKWVKYNEFFLFIPFFYQLTYRSDAKTDFHAGWLKRRELAQGCAFWRSRWHCSPFWGWNPPKTPIFGAWIGVFKPNGQNIESFMLSKLLHPFHHQEVVVGGPSRRPTNPRWRTAAILKKALIRYISATVWPILTRFGTLTHIGLLQRIYC